MTRPGLPPALKSIVHAFDGVRRAYSEFLTLPTCIIVAFVLLAIGLGALDHSRFAALEPTRNFIIAHIFSNAQRTQSLLGTIASGIITITSITISLLLIALQQSAGSMTARVFDQYLRRWYNQAFFGYFVGLSLYTLIVLATVDAPFNPVFGGTLALIGMLVALCLLVVLLYSTVNQTRPSVIIEAVHDLALAARERQLPLLEKTKRTPAYAGAVCRQVRIADDGFITQIDLAPMSTGAREHQAEVVLSVSIGSYVANGDVIADVRAPSAADAEAIVGKIERAVHVERQRDVRIDPAYAIEQLETIGWTSVSSSKHNPAAGVLVVENLRDILAHWATNEPDAWCDPASPVVYVDRTIDRLLDAFESLTVASSESKQHMVYSAIAQALAHTFERLGPSLRSQVESVILRMLAVLAAHAPTRELDCALSALSEALRAAGCADTATAVAAAHARFDEAISFDPSVRQRVKQSMAR